MAASGLTCSTTAPKAVPLMRASLIRTMSVTPCFSSLAGRAMLPTSAKARVALGAAVLQDHDAVGIDLQAGVVDACLVVVDVLEDHRPAAVLQQFGRCRRRLDDGAVRRQVAAQHADAALGLEGCGHGMDDLAVVAGGIGHVLPDGFAVGGEGLAVQQAASPSSRSTTGRPPA